jgi:hypothetical protein
VLIEENFLEGVGAEPEAERLERFGAKAELLEGDFLTKPLSGPFEAILARPLRLHARAGAFRVAGVRALLASALLAVARRATGRR